jgi:hypothetical protein
MNQWRRNERYLEVYVARALPKLSQRQMFHLGRQLSQAQSLYGFLQAIESEIQR